MQDRKVEMNHSRPSIGHWIYVSNPDWIILSLYTPNARYKSRGILNDQFTEFGKCFRQNINIDENKLQNEILPPF